MLAVMNSKVSAFSHHRPPKGCTAAGVRCSCFCSSLAQTAFVRHLLRLDAALQVVRGALVGPRLPSNSRAKTRFLNQTVAFLMNRGTIRKPEMVILYCNCRRHTAKNDIGSAGVLERSLN